jgi:hypothetical protein
MVQREIRSPVQPVAGDVYEVNIFGHDLCQLLPIMLSPCSCKCLGNIPNGSFVCLTLGVSYASPDERCCKHETHCKRNNPFQPHLGTSRASMILSRNSTDNPGVSRRNHRAEVKSVWSGGLTSIAHHLPHELVSSQQKSQRMQNRQCVFRDSLILETCIGLKPITEVSQVPNPFRIGKVGKPSRTPSQERTIHFRNTSRKQEADGASGAS